MKRKDKKTLVSVLISISILGLLVLAFEKLEGSFLLDILVALVIILLAGGTLYLTGIWNEIVKIWKKWIN